jgi:hypothetical protein
MAPWAEIAANPREKMLHSVARGGEGTELHAEKTHRKTTLMNPILQT